MTKSKTTSTEPTDADYIFDLYHELRKERTRIDELQDRVEYLEEPSRKSWRPWFQKGDVIKAWHFNLLLGISLLAITLAIVL